MKIFILLCIFTGLTSCDFYKVKNNIDLGGLEKTLSEIRNFAGDDASYNSLELKQSILNMREKCLSGDLSFCSLNGIFQIQNGLIGASKVFHQKSCEANEGVSCYYLSIAEKNDKNIKGSQKLLKKSCKLKFKRACDFLKGTVKKRR